MEKKIIFVHSLFSMAGMTCKHLTPEFWNPEKLLDDYI